MALQMEGFLERARGELAEGTATPETLLLALAAEKDRIDARFEESQERLRVHGPPTVADIRATVDSMMDFCSYLHAQASLTALVRDDARLAESASAAMDLAWEGAREMQQATARRDPAGFQRGRDRVIGAAGEMRRALLESGDAAG